MISLEPTHVDTSTSYFPLASHYTPCRESLPRLLKEASAKGRAFAYSERHLQAVWYDPRWRPPRLTGSQGEEIMIEYAGAWNLEAGPDFLGATLIVGPEKRRITGDVEIHIFPADWKRHGHQGDPRYDHVCLHLTYFEGSLPETDLPPGTLQASLRPALKSDAQFAFEHVDLTSYPYAGRADVPPCRPVLSQWPAEARTRLLEAAGHERMRRKAERFSNLILEKGIDQAFYEALMVALGYQHNKQAFHELATRLPADLLRQLSEGDARNAYALLAGMSGLLPDDMKDRWDEETRSHIRSWWDVWWRHGSRLPAPMTRSAWRLNGVRPLNHPLRRMMSAAWLITHYTDMLSLVEKIMHGPAGSAGACFAESLALPETSYWHHRIALGSERQRRPSALLGSERIEAILLNVILPMAAACGLETGSVHKLTTAIKPEPMNQIMKQTVYYLFGPDYPSRLCKTAIQRQGLLQIFNDYCINDRSQCQRCEFPGVVSRMNKTC